VDRVHALTGAWLSAAPVHQTSPAGAQQREERTGSSARASPGLGRRRGDRAMAAAFIGLGEGAVGGGVAGVTVG
jgi:anti-sigma factor RsiW